MPKPAWFLLLALSLPLTAGCGAAASSQPCAGGVNANDGLDVLTEDQLARKILTVTGAADIGKQIGNSMLENLAKMPNVPPGFIERIKENMKVDELTELIVPIYLKHYDRATMIAAIRFYQSEQGRKMVQALPAVTAESTEVGKAWGMALAKKAFAESGVH